MSAYPLNTIFSSNFGKDNSFCDDYFYRFKRYEMNFSVALFYSEHTIDAEVFNTMLRQSDRLVKIQDNLFCLVLDMTSHENGLKASSNILSTYEAGHFSQKLYVSLVNAKEFSTSDSLRVKLFSLLNTAIREDMYNQINDTLS